MTSSRRSRANQWIRVRRLVHQLSSSEEKIALFRSLFRGREDVYPRRFESRKTGKSGYAPACANEWVRGICEKPRIKCAECPNRRFLPVTDDVIRWHLSGRDDAGQPFVAGVYPMLLDETCFFLAVDFDKSGWLEDSTAFMETCRRMDLSAALERSRSGRGGHVWLFFEEAVPAALARKLGSYILTETMERRPDIGFDFVRPVLPESRHVAARWIRQSDRAAAAEAPPRRRQQRLPGRPGRAASRSMGLSLDGAAHSTRTSRRGRARSRATRTRPWREPSTGGGRRTYAVGGPAVTSSKRGADCRRASSVARTGPRKRDLHRQGRLGAGYFETGCCVSRPSRIQSSTRRRPCACRPTTSHASSAALKNILITSAFPRGCLEDVRQVLTDLNIRPVIRDERYSGQPLHVTFQGELRPEQKLAADAMLKHETGVLVRHDGVRQDGRCRLADRTARRQYAGARASAPAPRPVGRASGDVSGPAGQVDRPNWRRPKQADRAARCGRHSEPRPQRCRRTIASPTTGR